jgi:endo-1,4-beta-xylanase
MLETARTALDKPPRWRPRPRSVALWLAAVAAGAVGAVAISTPAQAALRDATAIQQGRFIGFAANAQMLCNNQASCTSGSNPTYRSIAMTEFNQVTPENVMKWDTIEPNNNQYNFGPADGIVAFAQANGMKVHGHTLVWHSQTPGYVQGLSASAMRAEMQEHIQALVGRYANNPTVVSWDVVNEAISDNNGQLRPSFWLNTLGVSYIADAFRFARQADPDADLCINDYGIDGINVKSNALYNLVQSLINDNVPITCVGFQGHMQLNQIPSTLQQNLQRFADLGLKVRITELDIRIPLPSNQSQLQQQAQNYTTVVNACLAVAACEGITLWGIDDGSSWLPNECCGYEGDALLWDANFQPKPAYAAVNAALGGGGPQVPGTPGTPTATNVTSSSVTLSWTASSGTVTNYQIERATGASSTNFTQVGTSTTTTFTDTGLSANTTYRYRVRAVNSAGAGPYSDIVNVTTSGGSGSGPSCTYVIDAWNDGYVAHVTVYGPTSGWSIPFTVASNSTIINSWNATISPSSGTDRTATNMSYNGNLTASQTTQWGFQATRPGGGPVATFPTCTAQ